MKVALVHDYLREYGGAERVLEVLHDMFPDAPVYTSYYYPEKLPVRFQTWNIVPGKIQNWPFSGIFNKPYTYFVGMSFEQFDLSAYDVIISSSANFAKGVITHPHQVHINYCHTPTRFLWGLNTQTNQPGFVRFFTRIFDTFLRQWDFAAAQRVDYFIANSETTQKRIKKFYQRDSEVVYPPCFSQIPKLASGDQLAQLRLKYLIPEKYFLVVSRLFRVKNIDFLVDMANRLHIPLVVVGTGKDQAYLQSIAQKSVVFTGFVPDQDLSALYSGASGFFAAAEDEDFGMTCVEAQSFGVPVLALKAGGYIETITEGVSGEFFCELDESSFTKAYEKFSLSHYSREGILSHIQKFSRSAFEEGIKKIIAESVVDRDTAAK